MGDGGGEPTTGRCYSEGSEGRRMMGRVGYRCYSDGLGEAGGWGRGPTTGRCYSLRQRMMASRIQPYWMAAIRPMAAPPNR